MFTAQQHLNYKHDCHPPWFHKLPRPGIGSDWETMTKENQSLLKAVGAVGRERKRERESPGSFGKEEGEVLYPEASKIN